MPWANTPRKRCTPFDDSAQIRTPLRHFRDTLPQCEPQLCLCKTLVKRFLHSSNSNLEKIGSHAMLYLRFLGIHHHCLICRKTIPPRKATEPNVPMPNVMPKLNYTTLSHLKPHIICKLRHPHLLVLFLHLPDQEMRIFSC